MGNRSSTKSGLAGFVYTEDTDGNLFMSGTFFTSLVLGGIALLTSSLTGLIGQRPCVSSARGGLLCIGIVPGI